MTDKTTKYDLPTDTRAIPKVDPTPKAEPKLAATPDDIIVPPPSTITAYGVSKALEDVKALLGAGGGGGSSFTPMPNQPASAAADVAGLVVDFNALLSKLVAAGLMAASTRSAGKR